MNLKGSNTVLNFVKNFIYNFLSSALPTVVLQFVIQPILARHLGSDIFGQYLTLMSLNFFIIAVTSAVLNTVRMLQDGEYRKLSIKGDFNLFLIVYAIIVTIVMPVGWVFYTKAANIFDIILYVLIGYLYLYHDYIFSQYRLKMQFSKVLINNIILVGGYFIGLIAFIKWFHRWQMVVITAYFCGFIYDYFNTDFIKEPARKTILFSSTLKRVKALTIANALNYSVSYFDKLLLYPILGGASVSVYYTASLVGKMLLLISSPLNSLVLSYLVKMKSLKLKLTKRQLAVFGLGAIGLYVVCVAVGIPLTKFLYPEWAHEAYRYIPITVAASVFTFIASLLNTFLVRFYDTNIQIVVQGANLALYLVLSLSLLHFWSLLGFSIGVLLTAIIKMFALIVVLKKMPKYDDNNKLEGDIN